VRKARAVIGVRRPTALRKQRDSQHHDDCDEAGLEGGTHLISIPRLRDLYMIALMWRTP
jgi:hypothetical protein